MVTKNPIELRPAVRREPRELGQLGRTAEAEPSDLGETPTRDLVLDFIGDARELVRIEVELAKEEVRVEARRARRAAIGLGIAACASILVLSMLCTAIVLALGATASVALLVAACLVVVAAVSGIIGYVLLPTRPLEDTRARLGDDVEQLREHFA